MKNLSTILLITLILFLVYLLYKRMLTMMGKGEATVPFAHFLESETALTRGNGLQVGVRIPEAMHVHLVAQSESGDVLAELHKGELEAGEHQFLSSVADWPAGEVLVVLETESQRAERYLTLGL